MAKDGHDFLIFVFSRDTNIKFFQRLFLYLYWGDYCGLCQFGFSWGLSYEVHIWIVEHYAWVCVCVMGFPCWTGKGIKYIILPVWIGNNQSVEDLNKQEGGGWTINFLPTGDEYPSSAIRMELTPDIFSTWFWLSYNYSNFFLGYLVWKCLLVWILSLHGTIGTNF